MHGVGASWKHFVSTIVGARDHSHSVNAAIPSQTFASRQERGAWSVSRLEDLVNSTREAGMAAVESQLSLMTSGR